MQQPVCIEGIPHAHPIAELETNGGAAFAQHLPRGGQLLWRGAVLSRQILDRVLAVRRHRGIQLERLELQLRRHGSFEPRQGDLQGIEPNGTPRAGNVGHEVDLHHVLESHGSHRVQAYCVYRPGTSPRRRGSRRAKVEIRPYEPIARAHLRFAPNHSHE